MPSSSRELVALYRAIKDTDNTTYVVTADLRLVRTNAAWARFAIDNNGENVLATYRAGSSILDGMTSELARFYRTAFGRALATGERWSHDYDCSSIERLRECRMMVFPIGIAGLVVTSSLRVDRPHDRVGTPDDPAYRHDGVVTMCASCRRVRAFASTERWDWVPSYASDLPDQTSHGMCPPCAATYQI